MNYILIADCYHITVGILPAAFSHKIHGINHRVEFLFLPVFVNNFISAVITPEKFFFAEVYFYRNFIADAKYILIDSHDLSEDSFCL